MGGTGVNGLNKKKPDMGLHGKEREGQAGQKQCGEVSRKGEVHSRLAVME